MKRFQWQILLGAPRMPKEHWDLDLVIILSLKHYIYRNTESHLQQSPDGIHRLEELPDFCLRSNRSVRASTAVQGICACAWTWISYNISIWHRVFLLLMSYSEEVVKQAAHSESRTWKWTNTLNQPTNQPSKQATNQNMEEQPTNHTPSL